jgi:hypothetical protein
VKYKRSRTTIFGWITEARRAGRCRATKHKQNGPRANGLSAPLSALHKRIGGYVYRWRDSQTPALTIMQAANALGYSGIVYTKIELGQRELTLSEIATIAATIGMTEVQLLSSPGDQ